MLPLAADENLNNKLVRGVQRPSRQVDILRVQDAGLRGADDPTVLEWAATDRRVLLTHDVATMTRFAYERVEEGLSMPGVFEIGTDLPLAVAIQEILLLAECRPGYASGGWCGDGRVSCWKVTDTQRMPSFSATDRAPAAAGITPVSTTASHPSAAAVTASNWLAINSAARRGRDDGGGAPVVSALPRDRRR